MDVSAIMEVFQQALLVALKIAGPILILSMAVGLIISVFQAATQIHEQTLTFVPKLLLIAVVFLVLGSWMTETLLEFFRYVFEVIAQVS
ncbi:MAG: flagellar biosynthesis protein FliQ [Clostridiales bacterium]|nr:flagellar biosynthesis protein FliQ [Clostridiales bacterium]